GGPAACAAPAGSRSDKKLRHTDSIQMPIRTEAARHRGSLSTSEPAWRGFLSLRDPTALPGRSGHPGSLGTRGYPLAARRSRVHPPTDSRTRLRLAAKGFLIALVACVGV